MRSILFFALVSFFSCSSSEDIVSQEQNPAANQKMYFPPLSGTIWETTAVSDLNWNQSAVQPLLDYLSQKHSKSFIILVNGKIIVENYFNGHDANMPWYWASAGKILTATVAGIAQQDGYLSIDDKVSDYLGTGWTSAPVLKENLITNRHLLTMTSGLDESYGDAVTPSNLFYKADAGTRWAYHNVYVKLQDVIANATGQAFTGYFNSNLRDKIGMTGVWLNSGNNKVYYSNTRSMARFGLLALANGNWNGAQILNEDFFTAATKTSQSINESYGFLWWLNGKSSYHLPKSQFEFPGNIIPSAPNDMFMALGKNDQKIYVIRSKNMVVIRMGEAADEKTAALSDFDKVLWQKLMLYISKAT